MDHLVFLYSILCYTFGITAYFFALLTAIVHRTKAERFYVLFLTAFLLFFIPAVAYNYFQIARVDQGGVVNRIFSLINLAGFGLMIFALPAFIHAVTKWKHARRVDLGFALLAVAVCVISLAFEDPAASALLRGARFFILTAVILYAAVAGRVLARTSLKKADGTGPETRWLKILSGVTILTLALMPCSVLIDMFPKAIPGFTAFLPPSFRLYPLFFMLWNLLYVIHTVPLYKRKDRGPGGGDAWDFGRFRLSPREREIIVLVGEGLSYRVIADRLGISIATVKTHLARIFEKTGAANKMDLANRCRRR